MRNTPEWEPFDYTKLNYRVGGVIDTGTARSRGNGHRAELWRRTDHLWMIHTQRELDISKGSVRMKRQIATGTIVNRRGALMAATESEQDMTKLAPMLVPEIQIGERMNRRQSDSNTVVHRQETL